MKTSKLLLPALAAFFFVLASFEANATKWIVNVQNYSFSPSNLPNVAVGDTIRWVWINGSHTTTSSTIPFGADSWDHPINSNNTFYEYPVTLAGVYNYVCTPHQGMGMTGSFTATQLTPLLVSIVPNQAVQGDSFMATITGTNTNFNGSPAVSLSFSNNPGEIINASSVTVITPTVLHAQFTIPANASVGLWDVHVNSLILDNGFTVILAVPTIVSIVPGEADQGESFTGTITGQYTGWSGTPVVSLSFSNNPSEIINGTNVVVLNSTHLTANFAIPMDASPGFWDVNVNNLQQNNGFTVIDVIPTITFMTPNSAHQGDAFSGTIYGQNTPWSGTPAVSLSYSGDPGETIIGSNVVVVNNTEITADFAIPDGASTGNYTIHVDDLQQPNGFTVLAVLTPALSGIDPDSGEQGYTVSTTITAENTSFESGSPAVSISLSADPTEIIAGSNVVVIDNTTLSADFNIPSDATPGLWDLNVDDLTLQNSFTVIELTPVIISIEPDSAYQNALVSTMLTAEDTRFTITEPSVSLSYSGNPSEIIPASGVTVLSDTELTAVFNIPIGASIGKWDVQVGSTVMNEGFTVLLLTGINDPVFSNVRTYPNPATNKIFIENATGSDALILDGSGKIVWSKKIVSELQTVDVSNYSQGIYILKLRLNGNERTEKLFLN
jgi:plastocyanin